MFRVEVELEDLLPEGLDAVASILFGGVEGKFTSDWALTGPIIEKLGVDLSYTKIEDEPDSPITKARELLGEAPKNWSATYEEEYEMHSHPLIAVIMALIRSKIGDQGLPLPGDKLLNLVKNKSMLVNAILEDSTCHTVNGIDGDINSYSLQPKNGTENSTDFQSVVNLAKEHPDFEILKTHVGDDGLYDSVLVKHSPSRQIRS